MTDTKKVSRELRVLYSIFGDDIHSILKNGYGCTVDDFEYSVLAGDDESDMAQLYKTELHNFLKNNEHIDQYVEVKKLCQGEYRELMVWPHKHFTISGWEGVGEVRVLNN